MKILITILNALTVTTTATFGSMALFFPEQTVKHHKHKAKHHNDNEENINPKEEKLQYKHAQMIAEYLNDKEFDLENNKLLQANGKLTWKDGFNILGKNIKTLFQFEESEDLTDVETTLLNFKFSFSEDNSIDLNKNLIITNYDEVIAIEVQVLPSWKKHWNKKEKIIAKVNIKIGGLNKQEVNKILLKDIANNITKINVNEIPIFAKGYISSIELAGNDNNVFKNQDLIAEIKKLLKKELKLNHQEQWDLNIKNENVNEPDQADLIAGDKIFSIDVEVGSDEQKTVEHVKKSLYVSVKIADTKDSTVLLEQTGKFLIKLIDDAVLLPTQNLKEVKWYKDFKNQLINVYSDNSYEIASINKPDFKNGSSPDLEKAFKSIVQKEPTVLKDLSDINDWFSESRYMEKIKTKFEALQKLFSNKKIQIKFTQQIADKTYEFSNNAAIEEIYKKEDPTFLKQDSKIILKILVDQNEKVSLETKTVAFEQFTSKSDFLAGFLCTIIEYARNQIGKGK